MKDEKDEAVRDALLEKRVEDIESRLKTLEQFIAVTKARFVQLLLATVAAFATFYVRIKGLW